MKSLLIKASIVTLLVGFAFIIWLLLPVKTTEVAGNNNINILTGDASRGDKLLSIAGCYACHTDFENETEDYSGGPALDSPFGTFYGSNITPDKKTGTGSWSLYDFERAVRQGISPDNEMYFPSMPYTSYNGLADQDVVDMWAAIQNLEPVSKESRSHALSFPFNQRILLKPWRLLFYPTFQNSTDNRGEYLVKHVLHCSECHTPRNIIGGQIVSRFLQGNHDLPDDNSAPDISKDRLYNDNWTADDLELLLSIGMLTDGDFVGGSMTEVVDYGTSLLSNEDVSAISSYLLD